MDYYWPQDIIPGAQVWKIFDNSGVFQSPLNGAVRTVSRPGTRIGCTISLSSLNASKRHRLMGLLQALKGRANRIWIPDFGTLQRGSFPAFELLGNTTFSATTGWTSSNAELVLTADSGRMRLSRPTISADRYASALGTSVSSAAYLFRAGIIAGRGPVNLRLQLGTTSTGSELVAGSAVTTSGYQQVSATASGTSTYAVIKDLISGRSTEQFQFMDSPSLARCALVAGGSQTGSGLLIDKLPTSTNGIAVAGDMCAVYTTQWEMKRLIADLNSNSSGEGYLMFEPGLRSSPADNAPVAFVTPMARFLLATEDVGWESRPGMFSDFQLEFVEDVT